MTTAVASLAAERSRVYRKRRRQGHQVLAVEIDADLIEALIASSAVSEVESRDRHALEAALAEMLSDWGAKVLKIFRDA